MEAQSAREIRNLFTETLRSIVASSRNSNRRSLEQTRFLSKTVKLHQPKVHIQHHVLDLLSATIEPKSVDKRTTIESIEQEHN
jgi:hypothetical protein